MLQLFETGHVACADDRRTGQRSLAEHCCVVYGVDRGVVPAANPSPGRGLIARPAGFFAASSLAVLAGASLMAWLDRNRRAATALPASQQGPSAKEPLAQRL